MPVLYILTNYIYVFLNVFSYLYAPVLINYIFYVTFCIAMFNFLVGYTWIIYPKITSLVLWSNTLNFCSFVIWYFQIHEFINYFLFFIVILTFLSSLLIFIYLLTQESIIEKTILLYKKIFIYSHIPIIFGLFSFGLIFIDDKEKLEISTEWIEFLKEQSFNLDSNKLQIILTKDFGFVKKIELVSPDRKILLQFSVEKNLCVRNPKFCKSLNYVRFYY